MGLAREHRSSTGDNQWQGLTDANGNWYKFSTLFPEVLPRNFVVVVFDWLGTYDDENEFSSNVITLQSPDGLMDINYGDTYQVGKY